jgi:hypothetical protein
LLEERASNIDIILLATLAAINDSRLDSTATTLDMDLLAADGIVVGVCATRVTVKDNVGKGDDVVGSDVPAATGSEAGVEPSQVAGVWTATDLGDILADGGGATVGVSLIV